MLLTDIKHLFSCNPLCPAYAATPPRDGAAAPALHWAAFAGGLTEIGHDGAGFAFDNEGPRHRVFLPAYALASRLVSNAVEYAGFIEAGGYREPALWLSEGWDWLKTHEKAQGRERPLYWRQGERGWQEFTLHGLRALDAQAPVLHVSYYEADAYARWARVRLPREAEWEHAARNAAATGRSGRSSTARPGSGRPAPTCRIPGYRVSEAGGRRVQRKSLWSARMVLRRQPPAPRRGGAPAGELPQFLPRPAPAGSSQGCAWPRTRRPCCIRSRAAPKPRPRLPQGRAGRPVAAAEERAGQVLLRRRGLAPVRRHLRDRGVLPDPHRDRAPGAHRPRHRRPHSRGRHPGRVRLGLPSTKTRLVLDAAPQLSAYIPIDISPAALSEAAEAIARDYPALQIVPVAGDFTGDFEIPTLSPRRPLVGFFGGSTIGNFAPDEATRLLKADAGAAGRGGLSFPGLARTLVKGRRNDVLERGPMTTLLAWTAAFNLKPARPRQPRTGRRFRPRPLRPPGSAGTPAESRMEMQTWSRGGNQDRPASARETRLQGTARPSTPRTPIKFTPEGFANLAAAAGWRVEATWIAPPPAFMLVMLG